MINYCEPVIVAEDSYLCFDCILYNMILDSYMILLTIKFSNMAVTGLLLTKMR